MNLKNRNLSGVFIPEIEFFEENDHYLIKAELAGMKREDVDISVHGNRLLLKGEKKEEPQKKEKNFYHSERRYGSFERSIEFEQEIDASRIKATYKDGVLEIHVPKSEKAKPKQIKVDVS